MITLVKQTREHVYTAYGGQLPDRGAVTEAQSCYNTARKREIRIVLQSVSDHWFHAQQ